VKIGETHMQFLTLGEAEDEVGVAKSTISRAIKAGRLSANRNEHGHYQIDPAELFRVYPPKPKDTDETEQRNTTQQPVQHHATPENSSDQGNTIEWMMKRLDDVESKLADTEQELEAKESAYRELREAYNALPSPESFDARLAAEVDRLETEKEQAMERTQQQHVDAVEKIELEKLKEVAQQKQQAEKWKEALETRQREIEAARRDADRLKEKAVDDIARIERRAAGERVVREALEQRGLIARLLNRKPKVVEG